VLGADAAADVDAAVEQPIDGVAMHGSEPLPVRRSRRQQHGVGVAVVAGVASAFASFFSTLCSGGQCARRDEASIYGSSLP
jgi:hypothetical protein